MDGMRGKKKEEINSSLAGDARFDGVGIGKTVSPLAVSHAFFFFIYFYLFSENVHTNYTVDFRAVVRHHNDLPAKFVYTCCYPPFFRRPPLSHHVRRSPRPE